LIQLQEVPSEWFFYVHTQIFFTIYIAKNKRKLQESADIVTRKHFGDVDKLDFRQQIFEHLTSVMLSNHGLQMAKE